MFLNVFNRLFGSHNDRMVKKFQPLVNKINALEDSVSSLSDDDLKSRTDWLRERLKNGEKLDAILPDAFATVREASKRVLGMRHFDVQLIGGMILHKGMITEMKTGEGKTLVATLPVYLNALEGKGVHVVTVNDYLAKRDAEWMGEIYRFLGLTVGFIVNDCSDMERKEAYGSDITYGTNNEYGFDYLRDNMKFDADDMVQRKFNYAIVDEVDSILVDEARTPLIISGPAEDSSELYIEVNKIIPKLNPEDYEKDEKQRSVTLTETGTQHVEDLLKKTDLLKGDNLYDLNNVMLVHHVNQALKAHTTFTKDVDYIVKNDKVIIIDEFTGRMMEGRRYSEGLHQALEAKEGVTIEMENQTLASITFQNYFRLYPKLAGMTGTAKTEEAEFVDIYGLEVLDMPTNKPLARKDHDDEVYRTAQEKYDALIKLVKECQERKQPVLVGTSSIEKSELVSQMFKASKITHNVLNARYHEQEAYIIAQAGAPGAVTIATNMAGRGTDIKLGGNVDMRIEQELGDITDEKQRAKGEAQIREEVDKFEKIVLDAGGLYVVGTERHESRRIDNQLRGRSGRQGDPGASKFFLSLEDDLMRIFGSDRLDGMLQKLGLEEGEAIIHPWVSKALERAQQKVEARNYDIRKHLLKYDDVMNDQRKVIYELRKELMTTDDAKDIVAGMRDEVLDSVIMKHIPPGTYVDQWDAAGLHEEAQRIFGIDFPVQEWFKEEGIADNEISSRIQTAVDDLMAKKEDMYGPEAMRMAEKTLLLRILDHVWKDHLHTLDSIRQGINLRAYAQRNPVNEYKSEAFSLFETMLGNFRESVTAVLSHLQLSDQTDFEEFEREGQQDESKLQMHHPDMAAQGEGILPQFPGDESDEQKAGKAGVARRHVKEHVNYVDDEGNPIRRNAPCPCGSGKRFKHCHGK
ncbi:MAG: preprotein translocase subunit SecA [Alphaproteobacteria bacterium]